MLKLKKSKSIKKKITLSIIFIYFIISLISIYSLNLFLQKQSEKKYVNNINIIGRNLSELLLSDLFYSNYSEIENKIKLTNFKDFEYILVYDRISRITAYKQFNDLKFYLLYEKRIKHIITINKVTLNKINYNNKRIYEFIFPIKTEKTTMGYIILGISEKNITSQLSLIAKVLFIYGIISFIIFSFFVNFFTKRLINPIKQLTQTMTKFAKGNLKARSNIKTNDEIEVLSETFNEMAEKINEQLLSIEKHTINLEKMVEDRTKELYEAMEKLRTNEKKINEMEKMNSLNTLVSSIAHHINNPLTIISGNIEMMMSKMKDEENIKRMSKIFKAVYDISNLIKDINFFSTIKDFSMSRFPLSFLINDVISSLYDELGKSQKIKIEIDDTTGTTIYGNINLLSLALENIIKNSIQIFKERNIKNPIIKIKFKKRKNSFSFEILDNGGGIESPERAMEPFYTSFEKNRGLGLTFVYFITKVHSGEILIKNFKNGTLVTLTIKNQEAI